MHVIYLKSATHKRQVPLWHVVDLQHENTLSYYFLVHHNYEVQNPSRNVINKSFISCGNNVNDLDNDDNDDDDGASLLSLRFSFVSLFISFFLHLM